MKPTAKYDHRKGKGLTLFTLTYISVHPRGKPAHQNTLERLHNEK